MREIKFRGYSIDDKCWVTGYGVEKITEDGFFIPTGCANDTYEVFKESIGEYTGIEDKKLNFARGNVIKYVSRAGKKDRNKEIEDLKKASWYLNREIERLNKEAE